MKWLQDNPLGTALLAVIGVFLLISLSLIIVGALPVSIETEGVISEETGVTEAVSVANKVGPLDDYQVINEKPVFNISRLPATEIIDVDGSVDDESIAIKDAPEVKLTGVIITPSVRIASLMPVQGKQESVMAREGEALTGEYVGWQVSSVQPRNVVLESRDGQKLELELQVHDIKIEEPPKPKPTPAARTAQADNEQRGEQVSEDGEPLSRAEQIRQRIAERREELRREQEEQQAQSEYEEDANTQAKKPQDYQSAIRSMINRKPKDNSDDDDNDE